MYAFTLVWTTFVETAVYETHIFERSSVILVAFSSQEPFNNYNYYSQINAVILGLVVHEILKMQSAKTSELERIRQGAKACAVLFPLLGMTWVFGILSVTDAGLVFQYIFTILNSLQVQSVTFLDTYKQADVMFISFSSIQTICNSKHPYKR